MGADPLAAALRALSEARHQAATLGNVVRALEIALGAMAAADLEGRFHLRAFVRTLAPLVQAEHAPEALRARLPWPDDIELVVAPTRPATPGVLSRTLAVLVDVDGSGEGFLAELGVEEHAGRAGALPPGCGAQFRAALEDAELAVLRWLRMRHQLRPTRARFEGRRFYLRGPNAADTYVKDGRSIGAAAAVVLFGLWTDRAVPAGVAITGDVGSDGKVHGVASVPAKVRAALRESPGLEKVIVPAADRQPGAGERVHGVADLDELLAQVFGVEALQAAPAGAVDVEGTVRLGVELYEKLNSFPAARELLEQALAAIDGGAEHAPTDELTCLWRIGSCCVHAGEVAAALAYFQRAEVLAERLWNDEELNPETYLGLRNNLAVLLRDTYRYADAERLLLATLALQKQLRQSKRDRAKSLGNLGELYTFWGRYDDAERCLQESLGYLQSTYADEVPRTLAYLGNLSLCRGEPEAALDRYRQGLSKNRTVEYGQDANEVFLRYGAARALLRLGRFDEAVTEADTVLPTLAPTQPYPRQLLLKVRGLAELRRGRRQGLADLQAAADATHVVGSLMRYATATASGELAHHWLAVPERAAQVRECLAELTAAMRGVAGLDPDASGLTELEAALAGGVLGEALREPLRRALASFPY